MTAVNTSCFPSILSVRVLFETTIIVMHNSLVLCHINCGDKKNVTTQDCVDIVIDVSAKLIERNSLKSIFIITFDNFRSSEDALSTAVVDTLTKRCQPVSLVRNIKVYSDVDVEHIPGQFPLFSFILDESLHTIFIGFLYVAQFQELNFSNQVTLNYNEFCDLIRLCIFCGDTRLRLRSHDDAVKRVTYQHCQQACRFSMQQLDHMSLRICANIKKKNVWHYDAPGVVVFKLGTSYYCAYSQYCIYDWIRLLFNKELAQFDYNNLNDNEMLALLEFIRTFVCFTINRALTVENKEANAFCFMRAVEIIFGVDDILECAFRTNIFVFNTCVTERLTKLPIKLVGLHTVEHTHGVNVALRLNCDVGIELVCPVETVENNHVSETVSLVNSVEGLPRLYSCQLQAIFYNVHQWTASFENIAEITSLYSSNSNRYAIIHGKRNIDLCLGRVLQLISKLKQIPTSDDVPVNYSIQLTGPTALDMHKLNLYFRVHEISKEYIVPLVNTESYIDAETDFSPQYLLGSQYISMLELFFTPKYKLYLFNGLVSDLSLCVSKLNKQ